MCNVPPKFFDLCRLCLSSSKDKLDLGTLSSWDKDKHRSTQGNCRCSTNDNKRCDCDKKLNLVEQSVKLNQIFPIKPSQPCVPFSNNDNDDIYIHGIQQQSTEEYNQEHCDDESPIKTQILNCLSIKVGKKVKKKIKE